MPLPIDEWTAALDRMTAALDTMRADLDRHRTDWSAVTDAPAEASPPDLLQTWLERRLTQWDARLTAAAELAGEVEQQLAERETAVARWQETFGRWRGLIEQGVEPPIPSEISPAG